MTLKQIKVLLKERGIKYYEADVDEWLNLIAEDLNCFAYGANEDEVVEEFFKELIDEVVEYKRRYND